MPPQVPSQVMAGISTFPPPEGALTTIPIGMLYLLFAPFPWQLGFAETEHHVAGDDSLVGFVSTVDFGALVFDQISLTTDLTDSDLHGHAFARLLDFPG